MSRTMGIVLPTVHIDGVALTFFEPLAGGDWQRRLAAALLTWLEFKKGPTELMMEVYGRAHVRLTEDAWYGHARRVFHENYEGLDGENLADALHGLTAVQEVRALGPHVLDLLRTPQSTTVERHETSASIGLH